MVGSVMVRFDLEKFIEKGSSWVETRNETSVVVLVVAPKVMRREIEGREGSFVPIDTIALLSPGK